MLNENCHDLLALDIFKYTLLLTNISALMHNVLPYYLLDYGTSLFVLKNHLNMLLLTTKQVLNPLIFNLQMVLSISRNIACCL